MFTFVFQRMLRVRPMDALGGVDAIPSMFSDRAQFQVAVKSTAKDRRSSYLSHRGPPSGSGHGQYSEARKWSGRGYRQEEEEPSLRRFSSPQDSICQLHDRCARWQGGASTISDVHLLRTQCRNIGTPTQEPARAQASPTQWQVPGQPEQASTPAEAREHRVRYSNANTSAHVVGLPSLHVRRGHGAAF